MLCFGLVGFACQSGEGNTRGRVGPVRAPVTVGAVEAETTALSCSLYPRGTQKSHTNTHSLEPDGGSRLTGKLSCLQHKHVPWSLKDFICVLASPRLDSDSPLCVEETETSASHQIGRRSLAEERFTLWECVKLYF